MLSSGALLHPSHRMWDGLGKDRPGPLLFPWARAASRLVQHIRPGAWADPGPLRLSPSRNIRVAVLPCSENTTCLFRTRPLDASDTLVFNEVFWVSMSYPALHQKTLRVDVCTTDQSHLEDCLVRAVSVCPSHLLSFLHCREKRWWAHLRCWAETLPTGKQTYWGVGRLISQEKE